MKEQKNSIDQLFQEQLADYEMEAPMHLLDGILKDKNKKRGVWWWNKTALALLLLVGIGGSLLLSYQNTSDHTPQKLATLDTPQTKPPAMEYKGMETKSTTPTTSSVEPIPAVDNRHISQASKTIKKSIKPIQNKKIATQKYFKPIYDAVVTTPPAPEEIITSDLADETTLLTEMPAHTIKKEWQPTIGVATVDYSLEFDSKSTDILQKTDCSHFGKLYSGIYAELSASLDGAQRQFSSKSRAYDSYLEAREAAEQQNYAYSLGFHLTALSKSGVSFTSGVDYHQIGEKFIYQDGFRTITVIEKVYDDNDQLIRIDTVSKTVPNILSSNNKYHLTQVPLLLGYEINAADFSMGVYAGPILNVLFRQEVQFLSPNDLEVKDYSNNYTVFRKSLGLGWRVGIGFGYRINGRHLLTIQPYIQSNPKSFTQDNFPLQQKYIITGIRLGWKTKIW